ncbi:MAG: hypothetical protein HY693_02920, partial [Deltaproteobacteria bacterium]|nr:hypothetical protein [Deltaproteobacteria bacterium]
MNKEGKSLSSLRAFFGKLVRVSFFDLGIDNEANIASYLTDLLSEFARTERLYKLRESEGRRIQTVVEMLIKDQSESQEQPEWEREIRKHIGDFTLFISGIFRDYVISGSYLNYYIDEGAKSYYFVSRFDLERGKGDPIVFSKLSRNFEFYSGALDYMRRVYFKAENTCDPFST